MLAQIALTVTEANGSVGEHLLAAGSYLIGRESDCDIVVSSSDVSRHHARITLDKMELLIEDLGSITGTLVQRLVVSSKPQRWPYPQTLTFGSVRVDVRLIDGKTDAPLSALWANPRARVPFVFGNEIARGGMGSM